MFLFFLEEEYLCLFEGGSRSKDQRCWRSHTPSDGRHAKSEAEGRMRGRDRDMDTDVEGRQVGSGH